MFWLKRKKGNFKGNSCLIKKFPDAVFFLQNSITVSTSKLSFFSQKDWIWLWGENIPNDTCLKCQMSNALKEIQNGVQTLDNTSWSEINHLLLS